MSLEAVQIVAAWLADPTYGLNALLATVPHTGETLPGAITIVNEVDDGWVARGQLTPETVKPLGRILAVVQGGDATWTPKVLRSSDGAGLLDGEALVGLVYAEYQSDTAAGTMNAKHAMRAARGSVLLLHDAETPATRRTRNGVELVEATELRMPSVDPERDGALITSYLTATYRTRESAQYIIRP